MLAAADPAVMSVLVAGVVAAGGILAQMVARTDRARLERLEAAAEDAKRAERRCKKALRHLGVDPDDFDDDDE